MMRWLPHPRLSVVLLLLWLLLNQTLAAAHVLLGLVLAVGVPLALKVFLPDDAGPRRPVASLTLLRVVLVDIFRSNITVARLIFYRRQRKATSAFMQIPLELRNPNGLTLLACIVTSTPGTLWVDYDPGSRLLLLHVLDLVDEEDWMRLIKHRYERLLLEIFE